MIPIRLYLYAGVAVVIALMGIGLKVQTARLDASEARYEAFVTKVKIDGERAQKEAQERIASDRKNKERANAESQKLNAVRALELKRLRDQYTRSGLVPPATPGTKRAELACFDRKLLTEASGRLAEGVLAIAGQGAAATLDLNIAKEWAHETNQGRDQASNR